MINDTDYDLRWTVEVDAPYLQEWLQLSGESRWFPFTNEKELGPLLKNWIGFSRFKCSLTAVKGKKPIAIGTLFLMPYRKVAHHSIIYAIVDPEMRRQGVGSSLIKNLGHLAKTRFRLEFLHAELYDGCPGIPLLKSCGYKEVFSQEKYVKEGDRYRSRHMMEIRL